MLPCICVGETGRDLDARKHEHKAGKRRESLIVLLERHKREDRNEKRVDGSDFNIHHPGCTVTNIGMEITESIMDNRPRSQIESRNEHVSITSD